MSEKQEADLHANCPQLTACILQVIVGSPWSALHVHTRSLVPFSHSRIWVTISGQSASMVCNLIVSSSGTR